MNARRPFIGLIFSAFPGNLIPYLTLLILSYVFWTTFTAYDSRLEAAVSSVLLFGLSAILSGSAFYISRRNDLDPSIRRAWFYLGLGFFTNMIAELLWFYQESILLQKPGLICDLFYLAFYPIVLLGILNFPVLGSGRHSRTILFLDLAIVMCTTFMALWYFVLTPIQIKALEEIENLIVLYYPLAGTFILGAIVTLTHRDITKITWRVLFYLGAGMFCYLIADSFVMYYQIHSIQYSSVVMNIVWMFGLLSMLVAESFQTISARLVPGEPVIIGRFRKFIQQSLPYLATVIGVVLLVISVESRTFSGIRLQGILIGMIALVGLVLVRQDRLLQENIKLYEAMQRIAVTDSLTGIHNRYFVMETLRTELQRAKRYSHPLSILMIDLDHFKSYNDQFGHLEGDKVLKQVAQILLTTLRSSDILGRYGGDEFIAILTMTGLSGAEVVAQKMQSIVAGIKFENTSLGVTIGVACLAPEMSFEEFIERADQNLYLQKQHR